MRWRCRSHSRLHLPRLWQDWPHLRCVSVKMRRKVEREGASPRERCRSPSQRGGIPVPPRLHRAPTAQDCGGTAGNWWFSSYVILHFLRTGVAPSREVSNGVFALRLGKCFSALFWRCVQKERKAALCECKVIAFLYDVQYPNVGIFFVCLLYMFTYMRDIVVVFAGFVNESRFFVGMRRFYCCMSLSSMKKSPCNNDTAISFLSLHG